MQRILHLAIVGLVCFFGPILHASADRFDEYWAVDEFLNRYPEQKQITDVFSARVRKPATTEFTSNKVAKIAIVYPGIQASDYWRRSIVSLEKRLQELGQTYEISSHFTKPGLNVGEQGQKLGEFLANAPDFLIFTLNVNRHKALISKLMARKSTHVILQNITTPLKAFAAQQPFQYVGFDHAIGTALLAQQYLAQYKDGAEYAIFYGPPGYVSEMRGGTFLQEMQQYPEMEHKESYFVGFDRQKAFKAAVEVLTNHPDLKFIFSSSTDIAFGVVDAIKKLGREGDVITNGWGGGSAELRAIQSGDLDFTVMRMNDDSGAAMADAIALAQNGRAQEVPVIYSGDIVLVVKSMSANDIGVLKTRAFRYSE